MESILELIKRSVFSDTFKMETETTYQEDGRIVVNPMHYELGQNITLNGGMVKSYGRMIVDADGNAEFVPSGVNTCSRYTRLLSTRYSEVRETKEDIIFMFRFRKSLGKSYILSLFWDEMKIVRNFFKKNSIDYGRNRS